MRKEIAKPKLSIANYHKVNINKISVKKKQKCKHNHAQIHMKNHQFVLLVLFIGVIAISGAFAGDRYCLPDDGKCPVACCPENRGGSVSVGYGTDYIHYGVRFAGDHMWTDVNYTFDQIAIPITLGVKHISSLGSGGIATPRGFGIQFTDNYGDETRLYGSLGLPSVLGFDTKLTYTHYFYPTSRATIPATGALIPVGSFGDSAAELSLCVSRELFAGVTLCYRGAFDFNNPRARGYGPDVAIFGRNRDTGSWIHELGLEKGFCITEGIALELSGGVIYADNYWSNGVYFDLTFPQNAVLEDIPDSGWSSYHFKAALPIALNCRATLTPYIAYNGTPDGWVADGLQGIANGFTATQQTLNANDVFHGGVSLKVDF